MDMHFEDSNKVLKKPIIKWREDKTINFIRVYRSHPCLWDTSLESYKNREARDAAYQDLRDRFDLTLFEVKNKIKNLRSTYLQELKKHRESRKFGSSPEEQYEPNLVWFKEMDAILKGTTESRASTSNLISEHAEDQICLFMGSHNFMQKVIELPPDSNFDEILPHLAYQSPDITTNVRRPPKKKWQQIEDSDSGANIKLENIPKPPPEPLPEDEFDLFGRHVAGQLRQMNIVRSLRIQTKIQYLIYKERMEELQVTDVIHDFSE